MVATELSRAMNGEVLRSTAGKIPMKLTLFSEAPVPFLEQRFEIQAEIIQGKFFPIYSVYYCEAGGYRRAKKIAEKKYHQFAKNFN